MVRKVEGGKLFRLRLRPGGMVALDGDFFVHPEDSIGMLEGWLGDCARCDDREDALRYLKEKLDEGKVLIIGAGAGDLVAALWEAKG